MRRPPSRSARPAWVASGPRPNSSSPASTPGSTPGGWSCTRGPSALSCPPSRSAVQGSPVSAEHENVHGFEAAGQIAVAAVAAMDGDENTFALNVNVPDRALPDLAGISEATLSRESLVDITLALEPDGLRVQRTRHHPALRVGLRRGSTDARRRRRHRDPRTVGRRPRRGFDGRPHARRARDPGLRWRSGSGRVGVRCCSRRRPVRRRSAPSGGAR